MKNYLKPITVSFMASVMLISTAQAGFFDKLDPLNLGKKLGTVLNPGSNNRRPTPTLDVGSNPAPIKDYGPAMAAPAALNDAVNYGLSVARTQIGNTALDMKNIRALYAMKGNRALWTNQNGLSNMGLALQDMLTYMSEAHGFESRYYLTQEVQDRLVGGDWNSLAELDILLTQGYMLFLKDMTTGRINPKDPSQGLQDIEMKKMSPPSLNAMAAGLSTPENLFAAADALVPPIVGYRALVESLAKINDGVMAGGWMQLDPSVALKRGDSHPNVIGIRQRLVDFGYLPFESRNNPSQLFDAQLDQAVRKFQENNFLGVDGVVGNGAYGILNQPVTKFKNQIRANLEKWRLYPRSLPARYLMVDMGRQQLDIIENNRLVGRMNVVVGKDLNGTPTMSDQVTRLILAPYWYSPVSIIVKETIPAMMGNPAAYLKERQVEVIDRGGRILTDMEINSINWSQYSMTNQPPYLFRQMTGEKNALGLVKFDLTNAHSIYLHDTNAKNAFKNRVRYLSHGCIRLEKPFHLAAYLLNGTPASMDDWNRQAADIQAQAANPLIHAQPVQVNPTPVYIFGTTTVNYQDGSIGFGEDVYKQDDRIIKALDAMANPVSAAAVILQPGASGQ